MRMLCDHQQPTRPATPAGLPVPKLAAHVVLADVDGGDHAVGDVEPQQLRGGAPKD